MNPFPIHYILWYSDASQRDEARDGVVSALRAAGGSTFLVLSLNAGLATQQGMAALYVVPFELSEEAARDHKRRYENSSAEREEGDEPPPPLQFASADLLYASLIDRLWESKYAHHEESGAGSVQVLRELVYRDVWDCVEVHREGKFPPKFIKSDRELLHGLCGR